MEKEGTPVSNEGLVEESLEGVDLARRELLRKLIYGAAVAVPVVTSFSIGGLGLKSVYAQTATKVCVTPFRKQITVAIVSVSAPCPGSSRPK